MNSAWFEHLDLLSSLNSYFGIFKHGNGFNQAMKVVRALDPAWFNYVHFNPSRVCLEANDGYKYRQLLAKRYHLTPKQHDTKRKVRAAPAAA